MRLVYNTKVHQAPNIQAVVSQSSIKNQSFKRKIDLEPWTFSQTIKNHVFRIFFFHAEIA